ncbi:MAG: 4-hydroxyphenylacetate 3-hydroxylase family protein [Acidobacteriota bacterium]|nr:4-hydroxyphenylacetate 3-hydroxylase family protein [Acidobacteriota bacterium]
MASNKSAGPDIAEELPESSEALLDGPGYLESLRDERSVYIYGERVPDVTAHPAFRNACRSVARLYDALHDPKQRAALTSVDAFGQRTHKFFKPSYSPQELVEAREAIDIWARLSYGFMGRTPDYKAAFMASMAANPEFYAPFDGSARAWYRKYSSQCLFLNHVLINPPVDRNRPVHEVEDVFVHVVRERDDGIIVSGAKMLATGSALTHATFVAQNSAVTLDKDKAKDFAIVFIAPMDSPGTKLICRPSYEMNSHSPFDHPLSSRFDENDAVIVFDNVFVPWENLLVYRDPERANGFYAESRFVNRYTLQAATRLTVKLEMMAGLFAKAIATNGTDSFRGVQAALGEVLAWRHLMLAMTTAMCLDPEPAPGGTVVPKGEYASTLKVFSSECWPAVRRIFEQQLAGSLLVAPSGFQDLKNEELRPLIDKYYRGSSGSAEQRVKLFKLIWDAIGTEFGARHELYEINYAGNHEQIRLDVASVSRRKGLLDQFAGTVESCLAEYNLDGWKDPTWSYGE